MVAHTVCGDEASTTEAFGGSSMPSHSPWPLLTAAALLALVGGALFAPTVGEAEEAAVPAVEVEDSGTASHPSVEMALADGFVSLIEYQAAVIRVAVCDDREAGFSPSVQFEDDSGGFSFTFPASDNHDEVHNDCRLQYLDEVEMVFSSQERIEPHEARNHLDNYDECLRNEGHTAQSVAIDSLEDQEAQKAVSSCIREL